MDADAWRRIEDLYHAATRLPPEERRRFINDACSGNPVLRADLESLLAYETSAAEFIEAPAIEVAGRLMASDWATDHARRIGTTVGSFRILAELGTGGMGVVYEAEDIRLGRRVALKFLPARVAGHAKALEQFEAEARAASALNHPNICTIYGVHDDGGRPFIEMERLEGETLRERLARGPLHRDALMALARQILDGLEAAHAKGIVHCDLTPSNVFLTERGAKILDFGIAKLESASAGSGALMGTAAYMSPEQARGEPLDVRTDLFTFGALLYEMSTGTAAFPGSTAATMRQAVLDGDPMTPRRMNPALPAALETIILRALRKDRVRRYQRAADMRDALDDIGRRAVQRRRVVAVAAGLVAMALGGAAVSRRGRANDDLFDGANMRLRQITHNTSEHGVRSGAISPNGLSVAYSDVRGIHVLDIQSGETRTIPESGTLRGAGVWDVSAGWFPDGTGLVANLRAVGGAGTSIWTVRPSDRPQKIRDRAEALANAPDGHVVFRLEAGEAGPRLMDRRGEDVGPLFGDERSSIANLAWSSDGRRVAYVRPDATGLSKTIEVRGLDQTPAVTVFHAAPHEVIHRVYWLHEGRLLYSLRQSQSGSSGGTFPCTYWQRQLDNRTGRPLGEARRLAGWLAQCVGSISLSADAKRLLYLQGGLQDSIHLADLDPATSPNATRLTFTQGRNIPSGWTPDSQSVVYVSDGGGQVALLRKWVETDAEHQITRDPGIVGAARLTPDGRSVLYLSETIERFGADPSRLMRVPLDGGSSQEVLTGHFVDGGARCALSPSTLCAVAEPASGGKQIVFTAIELPNARGRELARIDMRANDDFRWALAPDGRQIAALDLRTPTIQILSLEGRPPRRVDVTGADALGYVSWSTDGAALILPRITAGAATLLAVDLQGRQRVLWEQPGALDISGIPSPDGRRLAIWVRTRTASLYLAEHR